MTYRDNLHIEFRAVPYGITDVHVLEYRISPDQDLSYTEEIKFLCLKFNVKRKFKTNWHQAVKFLNWPSLYKFDESEGYLPIFIKAKSDLAWYKNNFSTIGSFFEYREKEDAKEMDEYRRDREEFLNNNSIWE